METTLFYKTQHVSTHAQPLAPSPMKSAPHRFFTYFLLSLSLCLDAHYVTWCSQLILSAVNSMS